MTAQGWVATWPKGIRRCTGHDHPVLVLQEVGGPRRALIRLDEGEALHLADVFEETRGRRSRMYETFEQALTGLGGTVMALRLLGDRQRGLRGEIEVDGQYGRQALVRAHPGDVAALAWRLGVTVRIPSEVVSPETGACGEWSLPAASETGRSPAAAAGLGIMLAEADPEDFDW